LTGSNIRFYSALKNERYAAALEASYVIPPCIVSPYVVPL
jgi:hypothetical protein